MKKAAGANSQPGPGPGPGGGHRMGRQEGGQDGGTGWGPGWGQVLLFLEDLTEHQLLKL